ncbi:MAG TPA: S8 family serine peptidase, partial [Actinomycetota bacterium]|nr:S8 family serine peptidase [Actinomycetota bacterium]
IHLHHREYNIRVVNNSWGGAGDWDPESSITKAVQKLVNEDRIVVVFAAGNSGGNGSNIQTSVWGNIPEVIQVANYYDRTGWLDATSSRGKKSMERTWPDVAAPGTEIISTAATGKPVTYVGNYQDAVINEISGYGEPDVITAPVPQPIDANLAGKDVIVGNYASFTGTSMASPFISGVVALILQANPALEPEQVKEILRATADMPPGRTYRSDGFAVGTGVVDAAEAVAVALRMKDGADMTGAMRTAYVDSSSAPWHINEQLPRMVEIDSPNPNSDVAGKVHVTGRFLSGGLTDNTIPFMPPPPQILTGDPHIYQGGVIDPFGLFGSYAVIPGEPVGLSVRSITSNDATVKLKQETFRVTYRITRGAEVLFGPADAVVAADGSALRSDLDWDVPADAPPGDYVFESTGHVAGAVYQLENLPFSIGVPVVGSASGTRPGVPIRAGTPFSENSTIFFENDFETNADGWTVEQNGTGPGLLTSWTLIDADTSTLTWNGAHSGSKTFYVGDSLAPDQVNGLYYEDLSNVSLVSPVIDLAKALSAELSYWRSGMSERDFDLLRVLVAPEGSQTWTKVDETSGDFLSGGGAWEPSTIDLSAYAGQAVRLKFEFTSDETSLPPNLVGWYIDDVAVSGTSGTGLLIKPSLDLDLDQGIGSLKTSINYSALSSSPIKQYELDFGDGTPLIVTKEPGTAVHTYTGGSWITTLKVVTEGGSASVSQLVDVARLGAIEVRTGSGPWIDAGPALSADKSFAVDLDLASLSAGGVQLQARHCEGVGACIFDSVPVRLVVVGPVAVPSIKPSTKPRRAPVAVPAVQSEMTTEPSASAPASTVEPTPSASPAVDASDDPVVKVQGWSASLRATSLLLVALVAASLGFVLGRRRRRPS